MDQLSSIDQSVASTQDYLQNTYGLCPECGNTDPNCTCSTDMNTTSQPQMGMDQKMPMAPSMGYNVSGMPPY